VKPPADLRVFLKRGPASRVRAELVHLRQVLRVNLWFPHVPLAVLTLLLGLLKVSREAALTLAARVAQSDPRAPRRSRAAA